MATSSIFTLTSALSLTGVAALGFAAYLSSKTLLAKKARSWQDRYVFIWVVFDTLIHIVFEGSWVYLSTFGRQVNTSEGVFAELWKEYARADSRYGVPDTLVLSLELLTLVAVLPLCFYILKQMVDDDPARHYWITVLCVAELYGGWMLFCPEWLTGSPSLNTSNALYFWVYLVLMNMIWVIVPLIIMAYSYRQIVGALRAAKVVDGKSKKL
ncbi:hypothetical protein M378DRAFT_166138 [Amanita muscaria Koide BX008]|uniref:EXPERA domain-containing protein n=1 Tax=Amanita muscaria (strain Koide BX008) TaxID=946122 RepID=A0A0C2WYU3_AMAMK|nr:hypothetical protein M378DRAFT_166138 [Amanita muscaria Koide BX008]